MKRLIPTPRKMLEITRIFWILGSVDRKLFVSSIASLMMCSMMKITRSTLIFLRYAIF